MCAKIVSFYKIKNQNKFTKATLQKLYPFIFVGYGKRPIFAMKSFKLPNIS